jgi:glycolate oxidase
MPIKKELYQAIEDVLGPENISQDPAITYSYIPLNGTVLEPPMGMATPMFEAVVLPKDTEEVQAIIKLCNKYQTQYKASSTGWTYCDPSGPNCIKIDLRRMNHIIEINEKNMYAVVEPYVLYGQLQAELMKRGLNCNITGAGANCSALPLAAHANLGQLSVCSSYGDRNLLAFEWVTPEGEIVRAGSLEALGEWFCGDGPGPSLRGIVRGDATPLAGLGVYTKAAQKLYHFPGPSFWPVEGVSPRYTSQVPSNMMIRYYHFPTTQMKEEAMIQIGESEIAFILMGYNITMITGNMAISAPENNALKKKYLDLVKGRPGLLIAIAGNSTGDFEYKKQVLQQIIEEYQGESLELVEDPLNEGGFLWRYIRPTSSMREVSTRTRLASHCGAGVVSQSADAFPLVHKYMQRLALIKADLMKKGLASKNDSTDPFVLQLVEHGHGGHGEYVFVGEDVPEAFPALMNVIMQTYQMAISGCYGVPTSVWGDRMHDMFGPSASNYHLWLRKVKKEFDPLGVSESSNYITAKES